MEFDWFCPRNGTAVLEGLRAPPSFPCVHASTHAPNPPSPPLPSPHPFRLDPGRLLKDIGLFDSTEPPAVAAGGKGQPEPVPGHNSTASSYMAGGSLGVSSSGGRGGGGSGGGGRGMPNAGGAGTIPAGAGAAAASGSAGGIIGGGGGGEGMRSSRPPPGMPPARSTISPSLPSGTASATATASPAGTGTAGGADSAAMVSPEHHEDMVNYLTNVLAFPKVDALQALSNTSGTDLAEALDYLCLHTDDAGLKRGFRRGIGGGGGGGGGGRSASGGGGRGGGKGAGGGGAGAGKRKGLTGSVGATLEVSEERGRSGGGGDRGFYCCVLGCWFRLLVHPCVLFCSRTAAIGVHLAFHWLNPMANPIACYYGGP